MAAHRGKSHCPPIDIARHHSDKFATPTAHDRSIPRKILAGPLCIAHAFGRAKRKQGIIMRKHCLRLTSALCTSMLTGVLLIGGSPAYAQTAQNGQTAQDQTTTDQGQAAADQQTTIGSPTADQTTPTGQAGQDIVVTGTLIRGPNATSPVPVTSISGDQFFQTGRTSVGDVLNDLPSLQSTFSQSNSTRFLGTEGLSLLDLRGLGTQRTLVLVNGRRHVAGDILNTATSVDVNTIPTDLIDRVDIVTGGDSAVYGSDAIAGVVNFVLKDHYSGVEMHAQGGTSTYGDASSYFISALAGQNFADGRGNIAIDLEYAHQGAFYASERKHYAQVNTFETVDTDGAYCDGTNAATCDPTVNQYGSDGNPDNIFVHDWRSGTYSNGGTFLADCFTGRCTPYLFQPNGTLAPQTGTPVGLDPYPDYLGGNGDNFRDGTQLGLRPKLDRYSANLIGHFDISTAFVPFIEATFSRTDSLGSASGPFFTGAVGERFYTDNPYLSSQARSVIRDYYADYFEAIGYPRSVGYDYVDQNGFGFYKNVVDLTNRQETARRDTYRAVFGVRGDFDTDWHYEVSANYGEFDERTRILGNVNLQRYFLAIDAVDQGQATTGVANGNIVCRAQVDPSSASPYNSSAYATSHLADDIAACVPVDLFGSGHITDAARNYLLQNSEANGKITQFDLRAILNGDSSDWFSLPGGPVAFALGAEYRRETNYYHQDDATSAGITFYNSIPTFDPPSFEVKEAFGELQIPFIKDTPFLQELTATLSARVSDYKGSAGTVWAYNGGLQWSPFHGLRLRGNYSRSVRAPNLSDLYTPLGQNYSLISDPCSARNINQGSSTRAQNCHDDGVPAGYDYVYTSSLPFLSGGNPNLKVEKSDSYTLGGVYEPPFLPGLSISADYYNITVNNVITAPSAQDIINTCYDAASIDNQFCALFARYQGTGTGPNGEIPGQILANSLQVVPLNYAKLKVSGIDFDVEYHHHIGNIGTLSVQGIYTLAMKNNSYLDPTDPNREEHDLQTLGLPKHAFNIDTALKTGPFTIDYKLRYLDKMLTSSYEDFFNVQGRPAENQDAYSPEWYPATWYHDIRLGIDATEKFNFYLGVDNVFNTLPPYGLTGAGFGSGIYDNVGRTFYAGVVAKF